MCCNFQIKDQKFADPSEKFPDVKDFSLSYLTQQDQFMILLERGNWYEGLKESLPPMWRWRIKRIGLSEKRLSNFLCIPPDSVSCYARGTRFPSMERLGKIEYHLRLFEINEGFLHPSRVLSFPFSS